MILLLNKSGGKNPSYEAFYARSLLQHGDIAEAEAQLANLKKALPDAALTREIEARVRRANDKDDEAISVVLDYVDKNADANLARAGLLLEELSKDSKAGNHYLTEAESLIRKHAEKSDKSERSLPLAAFLGRRGRIDEALSNCEKALQNKASPEVVAQVLTNVLREGAGRGEHSQRVENWIKEILAKNPDSVPVMICLADVYDYQERFKDAAEVYRKALQKDPDNVMVLNNLAWLLAFENPSEALVVINKAIDLVGEGPEMLDTRGVVYLKLHQTDKALKDLKEVVTRSPSPTYYLHFAIALYDAHKEPETIKPYWDKAHNGLDMKRLHPLEKKFYETLANSNR
jgi:tetratricopeptide (TPR) repeat protein